MILLRSYSPRIADVARHSGRRLPLPCIYVQSLLCIIMFDDYGILFVDKANGFLRKMKISESLFLHHINCTCGLTIQL